MNENKEVSWKKRLVLTLAVVLSAILASFAYTKEPIRWIGPGTWLLSPEQDCPEGRVCAEWDIGNGEIVANCCIHPGLLHSADPEACEPDSYRHEH